LLPGLNSFQAGGPSSSARSGGVVSSMGCMVPQPFVDVGNYLYPDLWVIISGPRYPGYKTLTVAPEPSVERAAKTILSTGGRIGTHMLLWVPSWDSVVRPQG
jgi:hypothetical protein